MSLKRVQTKHLSFLPEEQAWNYYYTLLNNFQWTDGIKNTRKACHYKIGTWDLLDELIYNSIKQLYDQSEHEIILGIYMNYYRDGNDYTPSHTHPKQKQVIISLGATRILQIGSKEYKMKNGDIACFGSSSHGIAKDPLCKDGRISIAIFLDNGLLKNSQITK